MKKSLTYRDILDLEYFFHKDEGESFNSLHNRDRKIYLSLSDKSVRNNNLLLHWLKALRDMTFQEKSFSPGSILSESLKMFSILLPFSGLLGGFFCGLVFFSYTGETPVNVFHFLFIFIFSQLIMLLLLLATIFIRLFQRTPNFPFSLRAYTSIISALSSKIERSVTAEKRNNYKQAMGLLHKTSSKYGSLMIWPFFTLSQKALIAVNTGILAATLFKVGTSDLAFGWQSTIAFSPDALLIIVQTIAAPWSWFIPDQLAYPSLSAIEGSRIILKDGIYHLATQNLVAWWPFLVFCLLFYGLLLRLALFGIGHFLQKQNVRKLVIDTPEALQLIQRMTTPIVSTQGIKNPDMGTSADQATCNDEELSDKSGNNANNPAFLLIPKDIATVFDKKLITSALKGRGFNIIGTRQVMHDDQQEQVLLDDLPVTFLEKNSSFILIMESWVVPFGDTLDFIKDLRLNLSKTSPIYIGLIENDQNETSSPQNNEQHRMIWKKNIDSIGDPYITLMPFFLSSRENYGS